MRLIGYINTESQARVFRSYLLTRGLKSDVEQSQDKRWGIWVHEETRLDEAKAELERFVADPKNDMYQAGAKTGAEIEKDIKKDLKKYRSRQVDLRTAWHKWNFSIAPLTSALIAISVVLTLLQHVPAVGNFFLRWLYLAGIMVHEEGYWYMAHPDPFYEVTHGQIWRLITPIFLHAKFWGGVGILHIIFNMMWLRDLGDSVEKVEGPRKFALHVLLYAVVGNVLEGIYSGPLFGGMSGVVYGLFAYVWLVGYYTHHERYWVDRNVVWMMLIWFVLCWVGIIPNVANWAHTGGLVMGAVLATIRLRRIPFTRLRW